MTFEEAAAEMELLLARATVEHRAFTEEEQTRFTQLRVLTMPEGGPMPAETIADKPTNPTRPVAGARSLSGAVKTDGLVARMLQSGRARVEVPIDVRALGSSQALNPAPGYPVQPSDLGPVATYHGIVSRLLYALDSIPVGTSNAVTYVRVTYSPDSGSPATNGNAARKVQELAEKPESDLTTEEVTVPLDTFAHWIPCSKQVLDDVAGLRALLDVTLVNGLLDKTDGEVFSEMTGVGRYTAFTPTGGEKIADSVARIATKLVTAGATGVRVAMHPDTMLSMGLTKTSGSGEYLGLPPNIPGSLVSSASVPAGKLLAWSNTGAVWANREGVSVVAGLNADDFTKNKVTLLAEHRGAVLTLDSQHVFYGNATA